MLYRTMKYQFLALIVVAALLAGCSGPTPTLAPTVDIQPTLNAQATSVAATVVADLTLNAPTATTPPTATTEPTATETPVPLPTNTLAPALPTATNTIVWPTWTPGPSATPLASATPNTIACSVTSTVATGDDFPKGADLDGNWTIKNTGSTTWAASTTDIRYLSGTKMHSGSDVYDLSADVAANGTYNFIVDLTAPSTTGRYTTTWGVMDGSRTLCVMSITIDVVE